MNATSDSVSELMELEREACRRFQAGDVDWVMNILMEDAIVCPPETDAIVGRENQRAVFEQLAQTEGVELSWEPIEARVSPSDEMAYVYGSVRWKMPDAEAIHGKYVSIWIKTDGEWKNAVEMRNSNG